MATFSGNPAADPLGGAEIVPITQGAVDKRTTIQQIADANESKSADLASATTTDLSSGTTPYVHITGTTTITGLGTAQAGTERLVVFDGILTLTHNATSLILPTGANITTAAGDAAIFRSEGAGNWRCVSYQRKSGAPLVGGAPAGSSTWVQYNNSGAFGAEAAFAYDSATNTLTIEKITMGGLLSTFASAAGGAGLRMPHGAAPTSPVDGDIWSTTSGVYARINGTTIGPFGASTGASWGAIGGTLSSQADLQAALDAKAPLSVTQNSKSAAYTLVLGDAGGHILHPSADTTARIFTIPANSSVAFPVGTVVTFVNQNAGGVITIAITTDTMRLAGTGSTGSRTLAANGIATAMKITSTEWIINGTGLT